MAPKTDKMEVDRSDSDSSSNSDDDDEDETDETIALLDLRLKSCEGRDYEAHTELVRILREKNLMKKLEKARESFSQAFPLTDDLWLEWIGDEARLAITDEDQDGLSRLYERALKDYSTTGLWLAYLELFHSHYLACDAESSRKKDLIKRVRDIAQRALARMGTDFDKGHLLWAEQRKFELLVLGDLQEENTSIEEQRERIRQAFHAQLDIPGRHLDQVLDEYKKWDAQAAPDVIAAAEAKATAAKAGVPAREEKEAAVAAAQPEGVLQAWQDYIQYETEQGDATRIRCLYERALLPCCLAPALWHAFLLFLTAHPAPAPADIRDGYKRAVRNCPFSAELWGGYCTALEKALLQGEGKEGAVETAVTKAVASVRHYNVAALPEEISHDYDVLLARKILRHRCEYLRRKWSRAAAAGGKGEAEAAGLRTAYEEAVAAIAQECGDAQGAKTLGLQWGDVEALHLHDTDKAVQIWDEALKGWKDAAGWSHVTDMLRALRLVGPARAAYKRGCNAMEGEASLPAFVLRWVEFERGEGDVITLEVALERYRHASATLAPAPEAATDKVGRAPRKKDKTDDDPEKAKRREEVMKKWAERKAAKEEKQKGKRKRGDEAEEEQGGGGGEGEGAEKKQKVEETVTGGEDKKSVFVQNIGPDASEDDVRGIFIGIGGLTAARVVRDKHGTSKGFAYADFASHEDVDKALQRDGTVVQGRKVEVSKSRPLHAHHQQAGIDAKTLYVTGLAPTVTRETVRELFSQSGQVEDVRMMRDRDGRLRGFCYVQFADGNGAQEGLKNNGSELEGRKLRVSLSDPSRRQPPAGGPGAAATSSASAGRGRGGKSMLSLMPRALNKGAAPSKPPAKRPAFAGAAAKKDAGDGGQKKDDATTSAGTGGDGGAKDGGSKKDNDFFRKLFSKGDNL